MPESAGELDLLRAYLGDRDVACPACGHNLRGAAGCACPECGARLDLRVTSPDKPHAWWIIALLSSALPLGLFGSLAIAGTWSLAHGWLDRHDRIVFALYWVMTLACVAGVVTAARRRTVFLQRSRSRQRACAAIVAAAYVALSIVVVIFAFRSSHEWPWSLFEGTPMP